MNATIAPSIGSGESSIAAVLSSLGAATLYEAQGQFGSIDPAISAIHPSMRLAGQALTVDAGWADNLALHEALLYARSGDVLVVDARACLTAGAWGDVLTEQALHLGLAGLVIDGSVRDVSAIAEMGFPTFSRGVCIRGTTKTHHGQVGNPVRIGGVEVSRGDYIVGDADGLVVVPRSDVDSTIVAARERESKEASFRSRIRAGSTTADLLGLRELIDERAERRAAVHDATGAAR